MTNGSDGGSSLSDSSDRWPAAPLEWLAEPLSNGVVALDPMGEDDLPRIVAGASDPEVQRWLPLPAPYTEETARRFLADQAAAAASGRGLTFAVRRAGRPELCGSVTVTFDGRRGEGEIGYWLTPDARGEGLAARGVRVLARWAIPTFELERVEMLVQPGNVASQRACCQRGRDRGGRAAGAGWSSRATGSATPSSTR